MVNLQLLSIEYWHRAVSSLQRDGLWNITNAKTAAGWAGLFGSIGIILIHTGDEDSDHLRLDLGTV